MQETKYFRAGKQETLLGLGVLVAISVLFAAFRMAGPDDFERARREVLLRKVGHELLLQSGDKTSRILPVKKIADNEYQLSFEKPFSFHPESLVKITQSVLANDPLAQDFVVNVINCANGTVAYGYAISNNKKNDIVSCIGRTQPVGCYLLDIKFKPTGGMTAKNGYLIGALLLLGALAGFVLLKYTRPRKTLPAAQPTGTFTLGSLLFDAEGRKLIANGTETELTRTETRVLRIFALSPNEIIERSRLQKEIWEDDGVIVGRSLDMFISKLRKKLEPDPTIRISVIRGKGYKLEIGS
jgi:Transcriptional regulatory protein, C terminal